MNNVFRFGYVFLLFAGIAQAQETLRAVDAEHIKVYSKEGRFGGWPANHGMWAWGDEILVGFAEGWYKDLGPDRHHIDREKPELHWLARSLDGGETWTIEDPGERGQLLIDGGFLHGVTRPGVEIPPLKDCPGGIDFTHPDFCLTLRTDDIDDGTGRFFYSYDRGHNWEGPFRLPDFGYTGTAPRTDYIVEDKDTCTAFITAAKSDRNEGVPICVRTENGGKTWELVSQIGPEPEGFGIMPGTVRLGMDWYYTTIRRREADRRWIGAFRSNNNGRDWVAMADPVESAGEGNPPALIRLRDGRLCLVWGYRAEPWSIKARLSSDGGATWGPEIILRDDGSGRDIGYCRSVQRPDGKVVSTYYFMDDATGPERHISATIWDPNNLE